ncbi:Uncharacterised protein, partial [Metamycoplasma alkalescens]
MAFEKHEKFKNEYAKVNIDVFKLKKEKMAIEKELAASGIIIEDINKKMSNYSILYKKNQNHISKIASQLEATNKELNDAIDEKIDELNKLLKEKELELVASREAHFRALVKKEEFEVRLMKANAQLVEKNKEIARLNDLIKDLEEKINRNKSNNIDINTLITNKNLGGIINPTESIILDLLVKNNQKIERIKDFIQIEIINESQGKAKAKIKTNKDNYLRLSGEVEITFKSIRNEQIINIW